MLWKLLLALATAALAACADAPPLSGSSAIPAVASNTSSPPSAGDLKSAEILKRYPPPGRMVDIGGRRLHILCKGPEAGPTVIIEAAAITSSVYYWRAQDAVAKTARVCNYDRAGLGWSDPAPAPRSFEARVEDLHALITRARIKGPYILVGHSMGGLLVRLYAKKYPKGIAGMVLVESSEEQVNALPENVADSRATAAQLGLAASALGAGMDVPQLRPPTEPPEQDIALRESVVRAGQDDLRAMADIAVELQRAGGLGRLGDIPLVVVTRGKPDRSWSPERSAQWEEAQARLAALSSKSVRLTAQNSGHSVHYDQPEIFGEAVKRAIELMR
jgi:pimeloyl-ACP methyl ester carboxylesterase